MVPTIVDVCPVEAPELPKLPKQDLAACIRAYGSPTGIDAACYDQIEAHRLAALLDTLIDVYQDVKACEPEKESK